MHELGLNKGFYILTENLEICGLAFAVGYVPDKRDFQITLLLGNISLAIGYIF